MRNCLLVSIASTLFVASAVTAQATPISVTGIPLTVGRTGTTRITFPSLDNPWGRLWADMKSSEASAAEDGAERKRASTAGTSGGSGGGGGSAGGSGSVIAAGSVKGGKFSGAAFGGYASLNGNGANGANGDSAAPDPAGSFIDPGVQAGLLVDHFGEGHVDVFDPILIDGFSGFTLDSSSKPGDPLTLLFPSGSHTVTSGFLGPIVVTESALEATAVPEPPTWLLVAGSLIFIAIRLDLRSIHVDRCP